MNDYILYILIALSCIFIWARNKPNYLYTEYKDYESILDKYCNAPCIYLDDNYTAPLTQDALQLIKFKEVYVTNSFISPDTEDYLDLFGNAEEVVLYIDTSEFWSSGYDAETILEEIKNQTEYKQADILYENGLSETYLLTCIKK